METQYDIIDSIVARAFDIEPSIIYSDVRKERVIQARFTSFALRKEYGVPEEQIARMYGKSISTIKHGLQRVMDMRLYDPEFKKRWKMVSDLLTQGLLPYDASKLSIGQTVRTRADSAGIARLGIVTKITSDTFTVESFDNPGYRTTHQITTGRLSPQFETSLDIVLMQGK